MAAPAIGVRPLWVPNPSSHIDWSHPLAQGLVTFAIPAHAFDYATGLVLTQGGTAHAQTNQGPGVTTFSSTAYWKIGNGVLLGNKSTFSIFAGWKVSSTINGGTGRAIYSERATSGNDICKLTWGTSAEVLRVVYRDDAGTLTNTNSAGSVPVNTYNVVGTVRTSDTSFATWINGQRDSTFSPAGMTATFTNANMQRWIGNDAAATTSSCSDGIVNWVACWTRDLSATEIAALTADPFCMLVR